MGVESGAAAKYREVPFVGASDLPKHADDIRRMVLVPLWFQPRRGRNCAEYIGRVFLFLVEFTIG